MENEHVLKSMKACVSETLSTLGEHFGQLLELALTREVQVSAGWAWRRAEWALLGLEKLWSGLSWGHPSQTAKVNSNTLETGLSELSKGLLTI